MFLKFVKFFLFEISLTSLKIKAIKFFFFLNPEIWNSWLLFSYFFFEFYWIVNLKLGHQTFLEKLL